MRTGSGSWYDRRSSRRANGTYRGTRAQWLSAYWRARVRHSQGYPCDETGTGIQWKADLIVQFERHRRDGLTTTPEQNRWAKQVIDEVMNKIREEEAND